MEEEQKKTKIKKFIGNIYNYILKRQCKKANNLQSFAEIISSADLDYFDPNFNEKLVKSFLGEDKKIERFDFEKLTSFMEIVPEKFGIDAVQLLLEKIDSPLYDVSYLKLDKIEEKNFRPEFAKMLLEKVDRYEFDHVLELIPNSIKEKLKSLPTEEFDQDFAKSLLEKSNAGGVNEVLKLIPDEIKNKDIWEFAISKNNNLVFNLIKEKVYKSMDDEEYNSWVNELVLEISQNEPDNFVNLLNELKIEQKAEQKEFQVSINEQIYIEYAKSLQDEVHVNAFLENMPKEIHSRELYEILLQKSVSTIKEIPNENFEEGLSQEEYETWLDDILIRKITEIFEEGLSQAGLLQEELSQVRLPPKEISDEEWRHWQDELVTRKLPGMENILRRLEDLFELIPREKRTEKVWNTVLDKYNEIRGEHNCNQISGSIQRLGLSMIPIQNITIEMCERALEDCGIYQITYIPSIDRKLDYISNDKLREEYEKWIATFSEEEKQSYREWYEEKVTNLFLNKENSKNIFSVDSNDVMKIPAEAISVNMINSYLQVKGYKGIADIPIPSELTNYNEQYEDIILSAISMQKEQDIGNFDFFDVIPEEYITDKVVSALIEVHPKYLDYVDIERDDFDDLLNISYKNKLENMGRSILSEKEIELMKKFSKNNANLFSTLNLEILAPEFINVFGEKSIERITRYPNVQDVILKISQDKDLLTTLGFSLENLKKDSLFIEPLIERLCKAFSFQTINDNFREFPKLVSSRIQDVSNPVTEEEKTIISYLALNPREAKKIKSYDEILNFVTNKNAELDEVIDSQEVTLIDAKNAYLERTVGMDYDNIIDLIKKYGNDPEQLLTKYEGKELESDKEKSEKEALQIIIKLKSLIEENDISTIKQEYKVMIEKEDKTESYKRYEQGLMLDNALRRAYGRDIVQSLNEYDKENDTEYMEHTKDGQEYVVRKLNGQFNRVISVMNAYRKSDKEIEGDMYDRWNTSEMANNHALCFSFMNDSNPGTALFEGKEGIIISISDFDAEALTCAAPYDLISDSRINTTITYRQQKFYTSNNLPDQIRDTGYSELVVEIQDFSTDKEEYVKIQPTSIICFEEIDNDSINAAIELSKKLKKRIPIELIDRRELAGQMRTEINALLEQFKRDEQPELVEQIITKFNNARNAYMYSSLADELLGEKKGKENPEAIFNKVHLNQMISECIRVVEHRIEKGEVQEGLNAIEQIKKSIKNERDKHELMSTIYERQIMSGIDVDILYRLDEIQRTYGREEILTDTRNESLEVLLENEYLESHAFEVMYGKKSFNDIPKQIPFGEMKDYIDISEIQSVAEEVHQRGYYSKNKVYSEEHIVRVAMFANAIANIEGIDDGTKTLLGEAVKYYSSGRMLNIENEPDLLSPLKMECIEDEPYQEYSAKIAGKELNGRYSPKDVGIVQAAIELQSFSELNDGETKKKKVTELCRKYNLSSRDSEVIDNIASIISDAVILDKARNIVCKEILTAEQAVDEQAKRFEGLETKAGKSLIKASYCIQEQLSAKHLEEMEKVAFVDWKMERDYIHEKFFIKTEGISGDLKQIVDESIVDSPMVREAYFRYKYREIDDPVQLGRELGTKREKTLTTETFKDLADSKAEKAIFNMKICKQMKESKDEKTMIECIKKQKIAMPKKLLESVQENITEINQMELYDQKAHSTRHIQDVILFSAIMAEKEGLSDRDKKLLIDAAKFHDCGRINDNNEEHGRKSAEIAEKILIAQGYEQNDINIIKAAIIYHDTSENTKGELDKKKCKVICKAHGVSENDLESAMKICELLKDADALDRTRFPDTSKAGLKSEYLRCSSAKELIGFSIQLNEAYSRADKEEIQAKVERYTAKTTIKQIGHGEYVPNPVYQTAEKISEITSVEEKGIDKDKYFLKVIGNKKYSELTDKQKEFAQDYTTNFGMFSIVQKFEYDFDEYGFPIGDGKALNYQLNINQFADSSGKVQEKRVTTIDKNNFDTLGITESNDTFYTIDHPKGKERDFFNPKDEETPNEYVQRVTEFISEWKEKLSEIEKQSEQTPDEKEPISTDQEIEPVLLDSCIGLSTDFEKTTIREIQTSAKRVVNVLSQNINKEQNKEDKENQEIK